MVPWDVRCTDYLIHQLNSQFGTPIHTWNVLNGEHPSVPPGAYMRADVRLLPYVNGMPTPFGIDSTLSVRLVLQVLNQDFTGGGIPIYTPCDPIGLDAFGTNVGDGGFPLGSRSFSHWFQVNPSATQGVIVRLWVANCDTTLPSVNCPIKQPPPWDACNQGELYDYLLAYRHDWAVFLSTVPPVAPHISVTPTTVQAGQSIVVSGSGFTPNSVARIHLIDSSGLDYQSPSDTGVSSTGTISALIFPKTPPQDNYQVGIFAIDTSGTQSNTVGITITLGGGVFFTVTIHVQDASAKPVPGASVTLT